MPPVRAERACELYVGPHSPLTPAYENLPTKTYSSANAFPSALKSKRALVQNSLTDGDAAKDRDPIVQERCESCGHIGLSYKEMQLRSADEGSTIFYKVGF